MKRVLCVDDDPFILELYAMAISEIANAMLARSAEDAMPDVERADAIVLDLGLPGMSGAELLQWIRERSDVPVLVVTGEETPERIRGLQELGASEVRTKPVSVPELRRWVELNVR